METMETPTQPLRQNRVSSLLARPWVARLIATLGIVVMTVGLAVPIAGRDMILRDALDIHTPMTWTFASVVSAPLTGFHYAGRMAVFAQLGVIAAQDVLILGGLALIPLLWRTFSPTGMKRLRWTYAAWLLALIILVMVGLPVWWRSLSQPLPGSSSPSVTMGAPHLLPGIVVFPLGALVNGAALGLLFREPLPTAAPAPTPRTGWQWAATLALTVGALVWLIGFYLMPEATTAACPPVIFSVTQFAHGACAGLDSDQALVAASYAGFNPVAFTLYTLGRHFELLVAVGGITALGGWTRQLSAATLAWLAAWPALALGVALVALQGVGVIARQGFHLTVATGAGWHMGPGMIVTFGGIGLVALGQLGLWRELMRRKGATSAE